MRIYLFSLFRHGVRTLSTQERNLKIKKSVTRLLGGRKGPHKPYRRHPDLYAKNVWLDKSNKEGIRIMAIVEKTTEKAAADELCRIGISRYGAELLRRHAANELTNKERAEGEELIATLSGFKALRKILAEQSVSEYRSKKLGL